MRLLPLLILLPTLVFAQAQSVTLSATGILINRTGDVLTNAHVVQGCGSIVVGTGIGPMPANLVFSDAGRDLALLRIPGAPTSEIASLRPGIRDIRPGDTVAVMGYPGKEGSEGQASFRKTVIFGLRGPEGEADRFQLANVIDYGSSGGPVLDRAGRVIGMVAGMTLQFRADQVDKPGAVPTAQVANVIALPALQQFLREHGVDFKQAPSRLANKPDATLAAEASRFTVPVHCTHY